MRVVPFILIVSLSLGLIGCKTIGKKSSGAPAARAQAEQPRIPPPTPPPSGPFGNPVGQAAGTGILAGRIIDTTTNRPAQGYIQVAESGIAPNGAPVEVASDNQGFFNIPGLQPGRQYLLTARTQEGGRSLAGIAWATPPNPKVIIQVREDRTEAKAPVTNPQSIWSQNPAVTSGDDPSDQAWAPGRSPLSGPGSPGSSLPPVPAGLGPPMGIRDNSPLSSPAPRPPSAPTYPAVRPQDIATGPVALLDHPCQIRQQPVSQPNNGQPNTGPPNWYPGPAPTRPISPPQASTRIPSCQLVGQTLYNFALYDLNGQPWEFRKRRGRLVLVDFWGTWCVHCLNAVPHLKILQERYGPHGLEVVGIAYEEGTPQEQVQKVNRVRQRLGMNYQVLLGASGGNCPVQTQFQVRNFPTMVLLDEQGRIIWRGEGLDKEHVKELEIIIKQRLGVR